MNDPKHPCHAHVYCDADSRERALALRDALDLTVLDPPGHNRGMTASPMKKRPIRGAFFCSGAGVSATSG